MTNSHNSGSRVSPAPLSPPALPSQQGEFFFSFFFPVHIFFRTVQHIPATLAPTTSHCRPPTCPLTRTAATATAARYPVGLCPDLSLQGTIPHHILRAGKFSHSLCLSRSTLTRPHLPPRHLTAWWSSPRRPTVRWPPLCHVTQQCGSHHITGAQTLGVPHLASSPGPHLVAQ